MTVATCVFRLQVARSNMPINIARLIAMLQYSGEQNIHLTVKITSVKDYPNTALALNTP